MANYVKFQRGSEQAYKNLAVKNQDTLYFVYDSVDSTKAKLYLGDKLLSGVGEGTGVTSLAQLEEVLIEGVPSAGSFLVFKDGKWVNQSVEAVAALIAAEKSLGFEVDEKVFKFDPAAEGAVQKLELIGFSEAAAGSIAFKDIDGKLAFGTPSVITDISNQLKDFNSTLESVVDEKIASLNHLTFKKVASLDEAINNNTIYLIPNPDSGIKNDYLEYLVVDDTPELLGNLNSGEISLDGYATVEALQGVESIAITARDNVATLSNTVGDITKLVTYNAEAPHTIIDELNSINERLKWEEIPV